jgi:oxaloacetate decarboxylase (Na+ extruding) subunit alpha
MAEKKKPIYFVDTTWRDGQQSLWGMMMTHGMFDAIASDMNVAGYKHVDTHAFGLWMKTVVRFFREDPFDIFDIYKRKFNTHCLAVMGEGYHPNFLSPLPGNISLIRFLNKIIYETSGFTGAAGSGRRFCMVGTSDEQDIDLPVMIPLVREMGLTEIMLAIAYCPNPRRTDAYYAGLARSCVDRYKIDTIMIKDAGGLLTEARIRTLLPAIQQAVGPNIKTEIHTHGQSCNSGQVVTAAMELGVDGVWTCIPPLAWGSSHVSIYNAMHNAEAVGRKLPEMNLAAIKEVERKLNIIADAEKLPKGTPMEYDVNVFKHQLPGGVVGTLQMQLTNLGIPDKFDEVLDEMARIIPELGNPISITPYSQWLVSQATMNVLAEERWENFLDSWVEIALGLWGKEDSGMLYMDQNLKDKFLSDPRAKIIKANYDRALEESRTEYTVQQLKAKYGWPNASDKEFALYVACGGPEEVKNIHKPYKKWF